MVLQRRDLTRNNDNSTVNDENTTDRHWKNPVRRKKRYFPVVRYAFIGVCLWALTFFGSLITGKVFELPEPLELLELALKNRIRTRVRYLTEKPSHPLRPENLEIVQKASPVDISYIDVSGGGLQHPHKGAKDERGNWGYVHDEKALRRAPPIFGFQGSRFEEACGMRDSNYKMLNEKVFVDLEGHEAAETNRKRRAKLFCLVYTTERGHSKLGPIRETWGPKCDGFMVASTKTDKSLGTVEIPHEGEEEYENIWQKVRSMWSYIYDHYYEEYDWFHIGGEDMFLIPENLRLYVESEEILTASNGGIFLAQEGTKTQTPLFLGCRMAFEGHQNELFNQGGSGYTMNKAALKMLVVGGFPNYFTDAHTFQEDVTVAAVLRQFHVHPYDTTDDEGGERYMPYSPGFHYDFRKPDTHNKGWYAAFVLENANFKEGVDHCAARSVSFHYIKPDLMYRLYALLYHICPWSLSPSMKAQYRT